MFVNGSEKIQELTLILPHCNFLPRAIDSIKNLVKKCIINATIIKRVVIDRSSEYKLSIFRKTHKSLSSTSLT